MLEMSLPTLARSVAHLGAFNRPVPATAAIAKSNRWFSGKFRLLLTESHDLQITDADFGVIEHRVAG
jgi:hypothetical protein